MTSNESDHDSFDDDFVTAANDAKPDDHEKDEKDLIMPISDVLDDVGIKVDDALNGEVHSDDETKEKEKEKKLNEEEEKTEVSINEDNDKNNDAQDGGQEKAGNELKKENNEKNKNPEISGKKGEKTKSGSSTTHSTPKKTRSGKNATIVTPKTQNQNQNKKTQRSKSVPKQVQEEQKREEVVVPEETVNAAVQDIIDGANPEEGFEGNVLKAVTKRFYEMKNTAHNERRYIDAEKYNQLMKQCSKAADVATFSEQCVNTLNELKEKENDAQDQLNELEEKWNNEFESFEEVIEEKKQALIQKHTSELDAFDESIPTELPPKYQKHSPEYIILRKKENSLARNQKFTEAEKVKNQADKLEAMEIQMQKEKLQNDIIFQRENLIQKQNKEINLLAQWVAERRNQMLKARDKEMESHAIRLVHYQTLVNDIEKKGLPPNPTNGLTTNRVSRKESIKAVRTANASQQTTERSVKTRKREELPHQYRPQSAVSRKSSLGNTSRSQKKSPLVTPNANRH